MAATIGRWNPAWGPEPRWQGPTKVKPKYHRYRVSCACTGEEHVIRGPERARYDCARCGAEMTITRIFDARKVRSLVQPGDRYGRMVILSLLSGDDGRRALCQCDCGKTKTVWVKHLRSGATRSCGCLARERASERPRDGHPWRRSYL